jgi:hypothetical protein
MEAKTVAFLVAWLVVGAVSFRLLWHVFIRGSRGKGSGSDPTS